MCHVFLEKHVKCQECLREIVALLNIGRSGLVVHVYVCMGCAGLITHIYVYVINV